MSLRGRWQPSRQSLATVVAATAIPVLLLFAFQWYLLDRFSSVTRVVLRQASQEVATRLAAQIRSDFESPMPSLVEVVPHDAVRRLDWGRVSEVLDRKQAQFWFVDRFLMWSRSDPEDGHYAELRDAVVFHRLHQSSGDGSTGIENTYPHQFFTDDLSRTVFLKANAAANARINFGFAPITFDGRPYYAIFHYVYDVPDRAQLGAIMGYMIDLQYLRDHYFRRVISEEMLRQGTMSGLPRPTALIVDDHGQQLYASDVFDSQDPDIGQARFPALFFNVDLLDSNSPLRSTMPRWTVRSGYAGATVSSIINQQTTQQRTLWFVLALITVGGFVLAVLASIQQLRLVHLKSAFVSSVSHELKTPLAKIQLFTDTLRSGRVRSFDKMQEYYDVISDQASRLERLVNGILEIARIEAGFREYRREPVDLRTVAHNALDSYDHELSRYGFHVELALATREIMVIGDAEQLETVVGNLISNAIKYSDKTKFISMAVKSDHKHGVIEVADRGVGIAEGHVVRIFDKFYRISPIGNGTPSGFGLGLAIVDHIIHAHHGRVIVHSEPGRGSTFRIELPINIVSLGDHNEADIDH